MPKIFISYRRSDSQMVAGRLRESLARYLGAEAIFRDKDSIGAGEDWTRAIEASLGADAVVLALIGPGWASARGDSGQRRLDDPTDWNRVELELALQRSARVIPLLIDETRMPAESELPESLRRLARINALKLRDDDWNADVARLVQALGARVGSSRVRRMALLAIVAAATIGVGAAGYRWWRSAGENAVTPAVELKEEPGSPPTTGAYLTDIREKLRAEQERGLELLFSNDPADRARAIGLIDANLEHIDTALRSFPDDAYLHALAGYAAKNVYASSGGTDLLAPEQRRKYLDQARMHFEAALKVDPDDPGALNGMGNVLFYERKFDESIRYIERAITESGGSYPAAEHDLLLVKRVKSGAVAFPK